MTLHSYFARKFAMCFMSILTVFALILALIALTEQLRRTDGAASITLYHALTLMALSLPQSLFEFMPLTMMLASLVFFVGLARSSELVVTRALGWSALHTLLAPFATALLIGALAVAALDPIAAQAGKRLERLSAVYRGDSTATISIGQDGVWLRQETSEAGQMVIHASSANNDGAALRDVSLMVLDPTGTPIERIKATDARLVDGAWHLSNAKVWHLNSANPEAESQEFAALELSSSLTPARISASLSAPSAISIWRLPDYIEQMKRAGFSTRKYALRLQSEIAHPIFLTTMLLIGAAFTMGHVRLGRTSLMVALAVMSGFILFFIQNFAYVLAENGRIPILLAVWAPPVAGLFMPLALILHWEDG